MKPEEWLLEEKRINRLIRKGLLPRWTFCKVQLLKKDMMERKNGKLTWRMISTKKLLMEG
jgi:hypothetical protein